MAKSNWKSPQAIIVMAIIFVIFAYIAFDLFSAKPKMKSELKEVKGQYKELSVFLDEKIPEIDSTFREHATQIQQQRGQINVLQETLGEFDDDSPTPPSLLGE
jgi:flagellar biosynthesis protein FlhB